MINYKSYTYYFKRYLQVGFPILLTSLSPVLVVLTDNMMVGVLGEEFRAAASYANALISPAFVLLIGLSSVLMPLVAGARVDGDYAKATRSLKYGLLASVFCGLVCVLLLTFLERFFDHLGQEERMVTLLRAGYFQIIKVTVILSSISQPLKRYLDGLGMSFINTVISFVSTGINIGLNYLLIKGHYGFPELGMNGAGIASFICRLFAVFCYLGMIWRLKRRGYITSFEFGNIQKRPFTKMLRIGLPAGFEFAIKLLYLAIIRSLIGKIGMEAQAASSIVFVMMRVGLLLPVAMGTAGSIVLAEEWRKGHKIQIWKVRKMAYMSNIGFMGTVSLLLYVTFPWLLNHWFTPTEAVKVLILPMIGPLLTFLFLDGVTFIGVGLLRGVRDTFIPFLMTTFCYFFIGLPVSVIFSFVMERGLQGILEGMIIGLICAGVALYFRFSYKVRALLAT
ncbi:MAG: MATE family efflux transporter [Bacteroidota bacterium]